MYCIVCVCGVCSQRPVALPVSVPSSRTSAERPQRLASVVRVEENLTQSGRCADVFGLKFGKACGFARRTTAAESTETGSRTRNRRRHQVAPVVWRNTLLANG